MQALAQELEEVCQREGINQTRDSTATQQRTCIVSERTGLHAAYSYRPPLLAGRATATIRHSSSMHTFP